MEEMISISLLSWVTDSNLKIIFSSIILIVMITIVASGIDFLLNSLLITQINKYLANSKSFLLQLVSKRSFLNSLSRLSIGLVYVFGSFLLAKNTSSISVLIATIVLKAGNIFNICILNICFNKCISIYHDYYEHKLHHNNRPIDSYIKVINFFSWIITTVLIISYIFSRSPAAILTGIGAVSAFILLIFKDTFLGIVASIQASATSLVKIGDWIVIDKYNIEGEVISISINSVKIKNSDNTITSVPTYVLTIEAVKNMQPMIKSGGRRFVEEIYLSPESVKMVQNDLYISLTQKYPELKKVESENVTNLTLLRNHILYYLENHEKLNHKYTTYVNTLAPSVSGIPLEIYAFTNGVTAVIHYNVKSEIIEYILAVLSDFKILPAQNNFLLNKSL